MKNLRVCFVATFLILPGLAKEASAVVVVPRATCGETGLGDREFTITGPFQTSYTVDGNTVTVGFDETGSVFFFTSTLKIDAVLVHVAGQTTVWDFGGETNGWSSLFGATPSGEWPPPPDAISFCYDYELFVNVNAFALFRHQHAWNVVKTGTDTPMTLAAGQTGSAAFDVTVSRVTVAELQQISGPVLITNTSPIDTTIDSVEVVLLGAGGDAMPAHVTCPFSLPAAVIPAHTMLTCEFVAPVPDTADRTVVATVTTSGPLPVVSSPETASFSNHTTNEIEIDECVTVTDSHLGVLGTVCAPETTRTFRYTLPIGPFTAWGPFLVENTATATANDTVSARSSTWSVLGQVPCSNGCSLSAGYWKTHSEHGPAPYDDAWTLVLGGTDASFFQSGATYHQAMWTASRGNAYWILAHQYIATELNGLNGASLATVQSVLGTATSLLQSYTPPQVGKLPKSSSTRAQFLEMAEVLEAYNTGATGPGACTEQ